MRYGFNHYFFCLFFHITKWEVNMNFIVEYWVEFLFTGLIGFVTYLFRKVKVYYQLIENLKFSTIKLLYIEIIIKYKKAKEEGYFTLYEKESIKSLYQEYKNLGGNQLMEFMDEIDHIPILNSLKEDH